MKRKILLTAMVAAWLVGSSAFASIARMAVLGTQPAFTGANNTAANIAAGGTGGTTTNIVNGALWYDDDYNMFYNPSTIMDSKNFVSFEKNLEGGWVSAIGDSFAYGVYVNRGGSGSNGVQNGMYGATANLAAPGLNTATNTAYAGTGTGAGSGVTPINTQRAIDLLFGGDMGIKWGVDVTWAYNRDQTPATATQQGLEASNRYWHVSAGAQVMGFDIFLGTTIASQFQFNNTNLPTTAVDNLVDQNIGVRYKYEAWTPYVTYHKFRRSGNGPGVSDPTVSGAASTQVQTNFDIIGGGVGHDSKIADGVHVLKNIGIYYNSVGDTAGSTFNLRDYKEWVLPINLALEAEAASWLTLRAGLEYDFWAERVFANNGTSLATASTAATSVRQSQANLPTVRIGSTMKFGKLHVDSAFGNGTVKTTGAAGDGSSQTTAGASSIGFDSNTFALVSASYHW